MVAQFLLANSTNGFVHHDKINEAAISYVICRRTVQYIWTTTKQQVALGIPINLTCKMKARELNVSKSHVGRWVQEVVIKLHTNQINLELILTNKLQRFKFSLNAIVLDRDANQLKFSTMHTILHIGTNSPYNHALGHKPLRKASSLGHMDRDNN
ncbi:hypothetical protein ACS0TY_025839 [Phlomoides rotata]